ncbi:kynureninase [Paracoccus aminophilus JCM 7686]|uniref:Kynureninase n=1 Tax=Paracoccus aminophilus JCM 7686 TaxID=1367847 RepID=S5YQ82_PARAH|nr:kynureninase [Paracoccus aminophilus JCM 7686]
MSEDGSIFARSKAAFDLPDGLVYLAGSRFGLMPRSAKERLCRLMMPGGAADLGSERFTADWEDLPGRIGDKIAPLIGVRQGEVTLGETLQLQLFQAISAAVSLYTGPKRTVVLTDTSNSASDLAVMEGIARALGCRLRVIDPTRICYCLCDDVAVLAMSAVNVQTAERRDIATLTRLTHEAGALTVWDLSHAVGALEIDLAGACADFAVGRTEQYLNGGPGAPAFLWASNRFIDRVTPALQGQKADRPSSPDQTAADPHPPRKIDRLRLGTPSLIALTALDAALDLWAGLDLTAISQRAGALGQAFLAEVDAHCPGLTLISPRIAAARGAELIYHHPKAAHLTQSLQAQGVIADCPAPDRLRIGFAPLYNDFSDIDPAVRALEQALATL